MAALRLAMAPDASATVGSIGRKRLRQGFGQTPRLPVAIDTSQGTGRLAEQETVATDLVSMVDAGMANAIDRRANREFVVIARGPTVGDLNAEDHEQNPFTLEIAIPHAGLTKQLGPAHLEELEVLGVMEIPHRVGLGVPDPHRKLMSGWGDVCQGRFRAIGVPRSRWWFNKAVQLSSNPGVATWSTE